MDIPPVIHKTASDLRVRPHWTDYEGARKQDVWGEARRALQGLPGGGLNIGFEAVDRHAQGRRRAHCALRFVARDADALELSYGELAPLSNRFANVLQQLGIGKGDRLFVLAGRLPALYIAILGALKNGTEAGARRFAAQFGNVRPEHHRHKSGRAGRAGGVRRDLPTAGRTRWSWRHHRSTLGRGGCRVRSAAAHRQSGGRPPGFGWAPGSAVPD